MPFLIAILGRWGVPQRFQRLASYITLAVAFLALCGLVIGAWILAVHHHDKRVIANHDAKQTAQVTQTELNAERTANANDQVRQQTHQAQTSDLNDARNAAIRSNPDETAKSAGPATTAVLARLREQAASHQRSTR